MGWFSKLLGRRNAPEEPEEEAPGLSERFVQLYCGNGPAAFVRQEHLSEVVGERDWAFSMDDGTLSFGDDLQFPVQVLGTESESSGTWLWAWANEASGLPDTLLEAVSTLRGLHDVPEAQAAQLPLESVDGHALCNALGPLVGAQAYYRGPYDGGAVFLLIMDGLGEPALGPANLQDFVRIQLALEFPDMKFAFDAYAQLLGYETAWYETGAVVGAAEGASFEAMFDEQRRLTELSVELG